MGKLLLALVLAAVVAVAFLARERRAERFELDAPLAGGAEPAVPDLDPDAPPLELAGSSPNPRREAAPARTVDAEPEATVLLVEGTIVVLDEREVEHAAEDGRIAFAFWDGSKGYSKRVQVTAGRFTVELSEREAAQGIGGSTGISLGGRGAKLELAEAMRGRVAVPEDGRVHLRARWEPQTLLHVLDARDGRPLAPVLVVAGDRFGEHPGKAAAKAPDLGPSPVRLPREHVDVEGWCTTFVRSPGFAWEPVKFDPSATGERSLSLVPGGELEVRVEGELVEARPPPRLRLRDASGGLVADFALREPDTIPIDGLAAGEYRVRVELGSSYDHPLALGETRATVVAGERTSVVLRVEAPPPVTAVPFAGTLELPREWELADFALAFERRGRSADGSETRFRIRRRAMRAGAVADLLHWTAPDSPPGSYQVVLAELGHSALVELPEGGTSGAHVAVAPPCDVAVRCLDADTGGPADGVHLDWNVEPDVATYRTGRAATWDAEDELWRFRAPVGRILLTPMSQEYDVDPSSHEVRPGRNEIVLRLERGCELIPWLRDGDAMIPWPDGFDGLPVLEPLEGQEVLSTGRGVPGGSVHLHSAQPGLFRLKVPPIEGYEPVPDEVVRLERGVRNEHEIRLLRAPR